MYLTAVRELFTRPGPFVTISAEVGRTTEDARQQLDARWTTIRHRLEHQGVGERLMEALDRRLHQRPPTAGPARRTIVAEGDEIVFDRVQAGTSRWPEVVEVNPLPDLAAWLAQEDAQIPFVLVVADRTGADIEVHRGLAAPEVEEETVQGEEFGVTKVPQGDWAQKQYQRSVENLWRENAVEVANAVRGVVRKHQPKVVILAGDERACVDIEAALEGLQVLVVRIEGGGRGAGASEQALWDDVRRVLADLEAHEEEEISGRLMEATGQGAGAVRGLDPVLDAFVRGQVDRLVVDLEAAREVPVDTAQHPGLQLPEAATGELPADRVLLAAAAAIDAEVSVLPRTQIKGAGVAALLRWDDRE